VSDCRYAGELRPVNPAISFKKNENPKNENSKLKIENSKIENSKIRKRKKGWKIEGEN
jgi:hypothetical protein